MDAATETHEAQAEDPRITEFKRRSEQARQAALTRHERARKKRPDDARSRAGALLGDELTDDELTSLAPLGWSPTSKQVRYARQHVLAGPRATLAEIAHAAEVGPATARRWRRDPTFRAWLSRTSCSW
jgi:hypothetical protein